MKHFVLLVDDEATYVEAMAERLALRGFAAETAYNGEQAIEVISERRPAALVLDLRMPGMDGIEVLELAKAMHPDIKVVVLTGHGTEHDRAACMELGAVAFFNKPIGIDILTQALRDAMEDA